MPASFTKDLDQLSPKVQLEVHTQELPSESCNSRQSYLADDVKSQLQIRDQEEYIHSGLILHSVSQSLSQLVERRCWISLPRIGQVSEARKLSGYWTCVQWAGWRHKGSLLPLIFCNVRMSLPCVGILSFPLRFGDGLPPAEDPEHVAYPQQVKESQTHSESSVFLPDEVQTNPLHSKLEIPSDVQWKEHWQFSQIPAFLKVKLWATKIKAKFKEVVGKVLGTIPNDLQLQLFHDWITDQNFPIFRTHKTIKLRDGFQ